MNQAPTPQFNDPRCEAEIRISNANTWGVCGRHATLASRREHRNCTYTLYFCTKHRAQAFGGRRKLAGVRVISVSNIKTGEFEKMSIAEYVKASRHNARTCENCGLARCECRTGNEGDLGPTS